jgi:hypothetical protein
MNEPQLRIRENVNGIHLEGLEDLTQTRRKIFLFQVIFPAKRSDVVHQTSDLLEFDHDHIPHFLVLLLLPVDVEVKSNRSL